MAYNFMGAGTATAAANQGQANRVVIAGEGNGRDAPKHRGTCRQGTTLFEKLPTVDSGFLDKFSHARLLDVSWDR